MSASIKKLSPQKIGKVTISTREFAKFLTKSVFDEFTSVEKNTFDQMRSTNSKN
jgi:hypothetical protein